MELFDFREALTHLYEEKKVSRISWNNEYFLIMVLGLHVQGFEYVHKSVPSNLGFKYSKSIYKIKDIYINSKNEWELKPSDIWNVTIEDILADDWVII